MSFVHLLSTIIYPESNFLVHESHLCFLLVLWWFSLVYQSFDKECVWCWASDWLKTIEDDLWYCITYPSSVVAIKGRCRIVKMWLFSNLTLLDLLLHDFCHFFTILVKIFFREKPISWCPDYLVRVIYSNGGIKL